MNYLTTTELSKIWNISTRRITFYCEKGRIAGAVKKGRAWLIPENAQSPIDKRKATSKVARTVVSIDDNIAEKGMSSVYSKAEVDTFDVTHSPSDIRALGLTRETLRYYEEIGLIEPKRQLENSYREFNADDIDNLWQIEFFKKRGFSPLEIKNLRKQSNPSDTSISLKKKLVEVEQSVYNQQCILKRLKKTQEIYESARIIDGKLELRDFPLYAVLKSADHLNDLSKFGDVFSELEGEDIRSHIIRAVSFDNTGFTGSKMCIVKKVTEDFQDFDGEFLESGPCIYTSIIIFTERDFEFLREKLFIDAHKWVKEHGVELKGITYGTDSFTLSGKNSEEDICQTLTEIWLPIK